MVRTSLRLALLLLLAVQVLAQDGCPTADGLFLVIPDNSTVEEDATVTFRCRAAIGIVQWEYLLFNSTRPTTVNTDGTETIALGFEVSSEPDGTSVLTVPDIQAQHAGKYTCRASDVVFDFCPDLMTMTSLVRNAFLRVAGRPEIFLQNETYYVDTLGELNVPGMIRGYPSPNVQVFREVDDGFELISEESSPRFSFMFDNDSATMTLIISDVVRADGGQYMIHAFNGRGDDNKTFTVMPRGPDPPVVSLVSELVAEYEHRVEAMCNIQPDAYEMGDNPIQWTNIGGEEVSSSQSDPVYTTDFNNGSVLLTIESLSDAVMGTYTCTATNERGTDDAMVRVFGPPPPPTDITIRAGNNVTWSRPQSTDVAITGYAIFIYQAGILIHEDIISVNMDHTAASYVIMINLEAGMYQVSVSSIAGMVQGMVRGTEAERQDFEIPAGDFPLIAVVAGAAAGGLLLLLVIGIAIGVYCYCSYNARKRKINSHQRRWGSEEDKVGSQQHPQPAIANTYTAIAVHDSSELPPSPLSPMPSSVGIDPKWEFPRENIKPLDVLAEGQFTVLYKGVAKNLREKPCEVAIKALKDDATEDDLKALIYEIDVLSGIEEHPNIVSLVRVCSIGRPLYMVMEYMCHGDLLGFLRACRGHHGMYTVSPGNRYQPPSLQLCSRDLLNMATKIANGMRYLADRKIVHRALCTRNILVGSGMDVKIYNVGSFDVTLDNREDGLVKWMAPETLFDGTNTTYSDVWSFGVTLWELVTVGGTPYGEILPEDLYAQLQSGMRMPCPPHCAQEVYEIMSACWQKNPTDRPHFAIIHESLDELVMSKLNYLDLQSYDGYAYSQFGDDVPQLSTAL